MLPATVGSLGEHALIARITSRLAAPPWLVVGPGDDAAVVAPERGALDVLTTDMLVEGVHFDRRFVPADAIGYRALAANLSDLAAMGARPRAVLLSLALPDALAVEFLDGMLGGLLALAAEHGVAIAGGNITRSAGPLVVDITALGSVRRRKILRRGGARPGDELYVTGWLGDAAAGLQTLRRGGSASGPCAGRFLRPEPRVRAGRLLGANRAASACIDLSDGLADGLRQMAAASGVGVTIDVDALPVSPEAAALFGVWSKDPIVEAVAGGDDYELLFAVRPAQRGRLRHVRRLLGGLPVTRIGVATAGPALVLRDANGATRTLPEGFEHFRDHR